MRWANLWRRVISDPLNCEKGAQVGNFHAWVVSAYLYARVRVRVCVRVRVHVCARMRVCACARVRRTQAHVYVQKIRQAGDLCMQDSRMRDLFQGPRTRQATRECTLTGTCPPMVGGGSATARGKASTCELAQALLLHYPRHRTGAGTRERPVWQSAWGPGGLSRSFPGRRRWSRG